jgi:hypothetical protein
MSSKPGIVDNRVRSKTYDASLPDLFGHERSTSAVISCP